LLDVHVGRWELPELARQVVDRARFYKATAVLIEDASSGAGLIQLLRSSGLNVMRRTPRLEKQVRAATQSACFEAGRVLLPKSAPWIADYETELLGFPSAKFDDQVDSTTQFLEWAQERAAYQVPFVAPIWGRQARPQWLQDIDPRFF